MKNVFPTILSVALLSASSAFAQKITPLKAPKGFDQPVPGVAIGRIDSISYPSKTVGTVRKALYTRRRDFSKRRSTRCYTCCTASAATRRSG